MKTKLMGILLMVIVAAAFTGCCKPLDQYEDVFSRYYSTTLKTSTSADVLSTIQNTDDELLSQSESVVAAWGKQGKPKDKIRTHWFNMVVFDEDAMTAARKYGFILEETNKGLNRTPKPALRFDGEMVLEKSVLDEAYASNNAKMIAILEVVNDQFRDDALELIHDSATLRSSSIMVQQAIKQVLIRLMSSPAEAAYLPRLEGMAFDHTTLGKSRIRMLIEEDIVKVKIKCSDRWFMGCYAEGTPFEKHPDVIDM
jgi:hypothetical protein